MKFRIAIGVVALFALTLVAGTAHAGVPEWVKGDFEITGFLSTGVQLSGDITDNMKLYVVACNGLTADTTARVAELELRSFDK